MHKYKVSLYLEGFTTLAHYAMKLLVVLFALVRFCAGNSIPLERGDNSHYVEGVSRYIWMPDGHGVPHLVDLHVTDSSSQQAKNGANNQYWLYTRRNPNNFQLLVNGNANSVVNSNYQGGRPTKVVVHGWNSSGRTSWMPQVISAYLAIADVNVIVVDWSGTAGGLYTSAVSAVPDVGRHVANFVTFLFNTGGGNWNNVHLIGHSLGAHVVGNAGRAVSGRPIRITGLDPAGPLWSGNSNALNAASGIYVESIHTDGGLLGIMDPISNADFYPNGGRHPQPGCGNSSCSHSRAPLLFASSVRTPNRFVGRLCSNFNQAANNQCSGSTLSMGNGVLSKRGSGLYGLSTGSSWPF